MITFNPQSPITLSALFFGAALPFEETVSDGFYKNGKPKSKKVKKLKIIRGLGLKPLPSWKTKRAGTYSVDEETLVYIRDNGPTSLAGEIASLMLQIRGLKKLISTYYESVSELIYPDGYVHAQFNHTATNTGRLSCKAPNIQNSPAGDSKVPEHFVSRFPTGQVVSADYAGIEVRIEAQLSGDEVYIQDIRDGVDFHNKNLALKEGRSYEEVTAEIDAGNITTIAKRKAIKGFTFAQQYGAGNKKISETTGFTQEEVQGIKDARRLAYPRLHMYYDYLKHEVEKNGQYRDPWGRIYKFTKYPNKFQWQRGTDSYSPTEIQNYRTQGFSTGSIVTTMVGQFWRKYALQSRNKYLMINTIHDSLMLDCKQEYLDQAKKDLQLLTECDRISQDVFNYKIVVPIEIAISHGNNWGECK